jgi:hypothetical protein
MHGIWEKGHPMSKSKAIPKTFKKDTTIIDHSNGYICADKNCGEPVKFLGLCDGCLVEAEIKEIKETIPYE